LGKAAAEAATTKRLDLQARIISLEGNVRARMGQHEVGLERVRSALALALEHNLSTSAAEAYQRLADSLEHAGEYAAARQTYLDAADFCQAQGVDATAQICLACLTAVLRQTGEWAHCAEICRTVLSGESIPQHARAAASGILGLVHAHRGEAQRARPLLQEGQRIAHHIGLGPMQLLSAWGLMLVDDLEGSTESAFERGRQLLELWSQTDERHYIVPALRWMASFFAV
jgi:tetratricopeptide (TPR) repeat protein